MSVSRVFAIVPAAGQSVRMSRPKLLLPLEGRPLIAHALEAWQRGDVDRIVVVIRPDDRDLAAVVRGLMITKLDIVRPDSPPPDMKASIQAALRHIEQHFAPQSEDRFLVAPADMPRLSPAIIRAVCEEAIRRPGQFVVPTVAGRRGHPVLFPWPLAEAVHGLAEQEGLDSLVARGPAALLPCDELLTVGDKPMTDIDTPDEYRRLAGE